MSRGQKILIPVLALLILGILMLIHSSPPPVDWSPSYEQTDSRPLGARVFYDLVRDAKGDWRDVSVSPFEALGEAPKSGTYVFINQSFQSDPDEVELLLDWVREGGHLFVSASSISKNLTDSLGLKIETFEELFVEKREFEYSLLQPMSLAKPVSTERFSYRTFFSWPDSIPVRTLGEIREPDSSEEAEFQPNFVQLSLGQGLVTLHTFPEAFSNYFLLGKNNPSYTEQVLGIWDLNQPILLDHYIKEGKSVPSTPLYLILGNPNLKAAYYACWVLLILWVVFEGKRRQKPIRIIPPLPNQSLDFARTIASIYLERKDLNELGQLQIRLFWDDCRTAFHLQLTEKREEAAIYLAQKSGVPLEDTQKLIRQLTLMETKPQLTAEDIRQINQLIEDFKSKQLHGRTLQPAR